MKEFLNVAKKILKKKIKPSLTSKAKCKRKVLTVPIQ